MKERYDKDCAYMKLGIIGEEQVFSMLCYFFTGLKDLRKNRSYAKIGINCSFKIDNEIQTGKIKTDKHIGESRNFLFETYRIYNKNNRRRKGWFYASHAKWLLFYSPKLKTVYILDFVELRKIVKNAIKNNEVIVNDYKIETDERKSTYGILISSDLILQNSVTKRVFERGTNAWNEKQLVCKNNYVGTFEDYKTSPMEYVWKVIRTENIDKEKEMDIARLATYAKYEESNKQRVFVPVHQVKTIKNHPLLNKS